MNLARAILLNSVDDIHNAIIDGANIDAPFRCDDDVDHCDCFFNAPRAPHERREHFLNLKTPIAIAASRPSVTPQTLLCLLAMGAAREIPGEIPQNQPIALAHSVAKASILLNAGARKGNAYANPDRDVLAFFIGSVGLTNVHTSNVQTAVSRRLKAPTMFLLAAGIGGETDETLANQKGWALIEPNPNATTYFDREFLKFGRIMLAELMPAFKHLRFEFIRRRIAEICIGMQSANWPALQTLMLIDAAVPLAHLVPLKTKWDLIVAVKHFLDADAPDAPQDQ